MMRGICFAVAACAAGSGSALAAQPTDASTAAVFAGGSLTFNSFSTVTGGPVVANGNVVHNGGSLNVPSLYSGGTFTAGSAAFQNTTGDVLFNGTISPIGGPGSVIGGNLTSANGSVLLLNTSTVVNGNVTAALDVSEPFSFAKINGNVLAGGNANIAGTVTGNVTYGGTYTQGTFASVGGTIAQSAAPVTPTPYQPLTLPAGRNLTGGANNITLATFEDRTLTPGTYGTLTFASGNTVSLTAGDYTFAGIANTFTLNELSFDTSGGPIRLFVDGDLNFNLVQVLNGQPLFAGGTPNPADSLKVLIEVDGSYTGNADLYGTVFAPNGNVTLNDFADVTGRVLAGGNVFLGDADVTVVPEPCAAVAMVVGAAGTGLLRRRRRTPGLALANARNDR
jgi:hypothetical protein